jgi:hypothetical protein
VPFPSGKTTFLLLWVVLRYLLSDYRFGEIQDSINIIEFKSKTKARLAKMGKDRPPLPP